MDCGMWGTFDIVHILTIHVIFKYHTTYLLDVLLMLTAQFYDNDCIIIST